MPTREKNREKKGQAIEDLQEILENAEIGIFTDYRGLTTAELNALRQKLDAVQVNYHIVKNTLGRFAATRMGREDLVAFFRGPLAIAFSQGEITECARVLTQYIREAKSVMTVKGGFLSNRTLTAAEVETLARLPSREVLIAKMLGGMQSPITGLVNCLASPLRGVMGVLQARIKQLEGA
ncbi:MAG: 50S ribosomal protein L10 [Chloroflexota bacterium]